MTEQERREKAIEEMAKILWGNRYNADCFSVSCKDCEFSGQGGCSMYKHAVCLYDAGYSKEEEVRKETIAKFIKRLREVAKKTKNNLDSTRWLKLWTEIENIKEEFGVEVEQ